MYGKRTVRRAYKSYTTLHFKWGSCTLVLLVQCTWFQWFIKVI